MPFYAVAKGRIPGIYKSWDECKEQIDKFPGAAFKKFPSESQCIQFIAEKSAGTSTSSSDTLRLSASPNRSSRKPLLGINNISARSSSSSYSAGTQRSPSLNAPKQGPSNEDASSETVDRAFLANLGRGLKRASTEHHDTRRTKLGRFAFDMDASGFVQVYTDGSCVNNGKVGARAGLGVYWGENHPLNISEPVRGLATNNAGEIQAAIEAIKVAKEQGVKKLCINTDSQFVVLSITMWVPNWKRKNWKLADGGKVKNATDFKELDRLYNDDSMEIKWNYVKAHAGNQGNERADQLAKGGAARYRFATHYNR